MLKTYLILICLILGNFLSAQVSKFSTPLPIVYLNTNGAIIPDEPKINAEMRIAWHEDGTANSTEDPAEHFSGAIRIEIRGSSSQMFPKKSYGFELMDAEGADMDFPLLGLPEEEDWILYAPYSDKSLIRNVLTFTLAEKLGDYAPRCRFVELFLNQEYMGVYVLMEKIKRDKNRVDIAKLKPDDISGEDLTGGYIIKIDKTTGSGGSGWYSEFENEKQRHTFYQYEYPGWDEINTIQAGYIQEYVRKFESALYNREFDPQNGYQQYIDIGSFIDYFIINEIGKNVDAYRLSTFLYKDKNEKLNLGPVWDFNLAFGNANYYDAWETFGLQIYTDLGDDEWQNPFWWRRFMGDRFFTKQLRCRWNELFSDVLSPASVVEMVDSLVTLLEEPAERNFQRWQVLGVWVWPNYFVAQTYDIEINWLKNWIYERMRSLHLTVPGDCESEPGEPIEFAFDAFPNPLMRSLKLKIISEASISYRFQVFDLNGALIQEKQFYAAEGENLFEIDLPELLSGIYFYRLSYGENTFSGKLVKIK